MFFLLFLVNSVFAQRVPSQIKLIEKQTTTIPTVSIQDQRPLEWIKDVKRYRLWKEDKQGMVYDSIIELDKYGFRITQSSEASNKKKHLFFTGCSATFGEGLTNEESFPFLISQSLKDWRVVNMGLRGAGVQDHLYFWRYLNFPESYPEQEGMMVYTIIPDHFARLSRSWRYLTWAFPFLTVWDEKTEGEFIYEGVLADKWDYRWAQTVNKTGLNYWWLRMTSLHSDYLVEQSIPQFSRMLFELKKSYLAKYPKGKFAVTWMRQPLMKEETYAPFKESLTKLKIDYWEPAADDKEILESLNHNTWHIKRDGHPTATANKLHQNFLLKRILKDGK